MQFISRWSDYDQHFVRERYNHLAAFFVLFEWLFWLPPGIRRRAVERLELAPGSRVLEVGCGTGRNLELLIKAVGREGHVYGLDISEGMLKRAERLCEQHGWTNVTLVQGDAAAYNTPDKIDGVLFSLSYATMSHHASVLRHAWNQLDAGGWLVIMDAQLPSGAMGKLARLFLPLFVLLLKLTVLGNPYIVPAEELREVADEVEVEELSLGTYFICRARKPHASPEVSESASLGT